MFDFIFLPISDNIFSSLNKQKTMIKHFDETGTAGTYTGQIRINEIPLHDPQYQIKAFIGKEQIGSTKTVSAGEAIFILTELEEEITAKLLSLSTAPPKEKTFIEKLNELGYV